MGNKQINELKNNTTYDERTQQILSELSRIHTAIKNNALEVKKALKIIKTELEEKQNEIR